MRCSKQRISILGRGSFAIVSLVKLQFSDGTRMLAAVKSASNPVYLPMIVEESLILSEFKGCPEIVQIIGHDACIVHEKIPIFNMYLEYAPCGSLADLIKSGPLPEQQVRDYTKCLLKGLVEIHKKHYVHCDIKPANVLVWSSTEVKITDFGLAKRSGVKAKGFGPYNIRATPLYIAPECLTRGEYEPELDIWSLGCTVVEMITGMTAVDPNGYLNMETLLDEISNGSATPEIPEMLTEAGKDFLKFCFFREPALRWSADMLLNHPFILGRVGDWCDCYGFLSDNDELVRRADEKDSELEAAFMRGLNRGIEQLGI